MMHDGSSGPSPFIPKRSDMGRKAKRAFWKGNPFKQGHCKVLKKKR